MKRYRWSLGFFVAAIVWLLLSVSDGQDQRQFFGLWRLSSLIIGLGFFWLTIISALSVVSRQAAFKGIAVTLALGFALAITEVISWFSTDGLWTAGTLSKLGTEELVRETHSGQTYQDLFNRWGIASDPIAFEYTTDRRGFRHQLDHADPDVFLLGDSILVSALLPFENTVTGQVDEALDEPVVNLALIGIGPQRQLDMLKANVADLTGKRVVQFVFEGNDLLDSSRYKQGKKERSKVESRSFLYPLMLSVQRWSDPVHPVARRQMGSIQGKDYAFLWDRTSFEGLEDEIQNLQSTLEETRRFVEQAGGTYAVVFVPAKIRVVGPLCDFPEFSNLLPVETHLNPLRGALTEWAERQKVSWLDLTDPLTESAQDGAIPFFPGDTHLNAVGHAVMAKSLLDSEILSYRARDH